MTTRKTNLKKKVTGGIGAADYGVKVFGDIGSQTRGADGSIKLHVGGSTQKYKKGKKGGKGILTNIAVPAVLVYTNGLTGSSKSKKSRKHRNKTSKKSKK